MNVDMTKRIMILNNIILINTCITSILICVIFIISICIFMSRVLFHIYRLSTNHDV